MKKQLISLFTLCGIIALTFGGCSKEETPAPEPANPYGGTNGKIVFTAVNVTETYPINPFPIEVYVNNVKIGQWTGALVSQPSGEEACNMSTTSHSIIYIDEPGTYNFKAAGFGGTVNGQFTIKEGICTHQPTNI